MRIVVLTCRINPTGNPQVFHERRRKYLVAGFTATSATGVVSAFVDIEPVLSLAR